MEKIQLACAVCRILVYRLINCLTRRTPEPPKPVKNVLALGLSESGKSTVLALLAGEPVDDIQPTKGFHIKDIILKKCILTVKELGGAINIRKYWSHYYDGQQGMIYMVNGSYNTDQLDAAYSAFIEAVQHPSLKHVPILLLVTFQDKENCISPNELDKMWDLSDTFGSRISLCGFSPHGLQQVRDALEEFGGSVIQFASLSHVDLKEKI